VHGAAPQQSGQYRPGAGKNRPHGRKPGQRSGGPSVLGGGVYSAPMDHSYRAAQGNNNGNTHKPSRGGRINQPQGKEFAPPEPEPLPVASDAPARIFAFVDDLFFLAKIQETARKMNVKVEFVKTQKELQEKMGQNGEEKPSLIIFDLNNVAAKPLSMIPKLKAKLKKATNIIAFVSHVQGELKMKAQEAGCDMVLPRSAFSQNLAQLLRRHGAPEPPPDPGQ
jgi:CheY-like chemotaxis protein